MTNTRASLCAAISAVLSGSEHAQSILLSGVKASLYDTEQTQGRVYAPQTRPFLEGLSMSEGSYFALLWVELSMRRRSIFGALKL